jgi:DNA-binding NarL/FixJ family response regulator
MQKVKGEIILIDEQKFEKELINVSLDTLHYDIYIKYLNNIENAIDYLRKTKETIFLIIADFNLGKRRGGLQLKKVIDNDEELKRKSVPFVFTSADPTRAEVDEAYDYNIQGFYKKPESMEELDDILKIIVKYWILNKRPNQL